MNRGLPNLLKGDVVPGDANTDLSGSSSRVSSQDPIRCDMEGCRRFAAYTVSRGTVVREVCRRCKDEMTAVYGWSLLGRG